MPNTFISSGFSGHVSLQTHRRNKQATHDGSVWFRKQRNVKELDNTNKWQRTNSSKMRANTTFCERVLIYASVRGLYNPHLHHKLHLSLECSIEHMKYFGVYQTCACLFRYEWILFYSAPFDWDFRKTLKTYFRECVEPECWQTQRNWDGLINSIQLEINVTWRAYAIILKRFVWLTRLMERFNWTQFDIEQYFVIFSICPFNFFRFLPFA